MAARVHTAVPPLRCGSKGTAQPPMFGVMPTRAWYAARLAQPRPWWKRLLGARPTSS